jgi:hypothetical protein
MGEQGRGRQRGRGSLDGGEERAFSQETTKSENALASREPNPK